MKKNDNLRLLKPGNYMQQDTNRIVKIVDPTPCLLIETKHDPCMVVFTRGKRLVAWETNIIETTGHR